MGRSLLFSVLPVALALSAGAADSARVDLTAFVGTWEENLAKSQVRASSAPTFSFTQQPGGSILLVRRLGGRTIRDSLRMDGKDHPSPDTPSRSVSLTVLNENTFEMVTKGDGKVLSRRRWVIALGGRTLTEESTAPSDSGPPQVTTTVYERSSTGDSGLLGEWKATAVRRTTPRTLALTLSGTGGLTYRGDDQKTYTARVDGKEYPYIGPNMRAGVTVVLEALGERSIKETYFFNHQRLSEGKMTVSQDGKTLIMVQAASNGKPDEPPSVLVFEKQ
jgi:hypothetical protein